ncbi:uncharacterized protein LOC111046994 [Nilaparvata lugens]|uniref:uncharacterized protein LOC111046994 n=1 Tax=Nilaparvata lugens TaxID=108931 RepID=UPI00193E88AF|nr:uncharacterized protein LOC111046994 [Nilaparvata lugens]XP_039292284.1 uncharacterized protein LOC111046994 [Nilaparvata lugens]
MDYLSLKSSDISTSQESRRPVEEILDLLSDDRCIKEATDDLSDASILTPPFSEFSIVDGRPSLGHSVTCYHWSADYLAVLDEIDDEECENLSVPCSSCSFCSSCTSDTWEVLGITNDLFKKPREFSKKFKREIDGLIRSGATGDKEFDKVFVDAISDTKSEASSRDLQRKPRKRSTTDFDPLSGLWNMLSTYDDFQVTAPGFNVSQQEKPHWLDQEAMPWQLKEKSRVKCMNWLTKYHK